MENFQDMFETRKQSFISAFSICLTVLLSHLATREATRMYQFITNNQASFHLW